MATDSVMGLFATPQMIQQAQQQQFASTAANLAQLDPAKLANFYGMTGGYALGNALGSALGAQDPQLQAASIRQQVVKNIDWNDPTSIANASRNLLERGDAAGSQQLATLAQQARDKQLATVKTTSEIAKNLDTRSTNQKDYEAAVNGGYKGTFNDWLMQKTREGATKLSVDNKQEGSFASALGTAQAKGLMDSKAAAEDAATILETNEVGRKLLSSGAITGTGAGFFVGLNSALKQAGIDFGYGDAAANTQAYAAAMGSNVGKLIKQFGAGTGLSDADRKYATQIAAGDISIDEKAIRRILDINDKASRNIINKHNKRVSGIKTNVPLTVDIPVGQPASPASPVAQIPTTGGSGLTGNSLVDKYLVKPQGQ